MFCALCLGLLHALPANAIPFGACDARMFLTQAPDGSTPTTVYNIGTSTNPFTYDLLGAGSVNYNGTGYNPADNYLYAIQSSTNHLLRIAADGSTVDLGPVIGLAGIAASTLNYRSGTFDATGSRYFVIDGNASNAANIQRLYVIDVTTNTASFITLTQAIGDLIADLAYVNGLLYSVKVDGQLISIDPSTGQVTNIGVPNGVTTNVFFGALFGAPNGLFGSLNNGGFYQIDIATGAVTLLSGAPGSNANDGAHCAAANITFGADLQVTKTNTPGVGPSDQAGDTYTPGTDVVYTIVVSNAGPFGAQNVMVSDQLPAGIATANWTCVGAGGGICTASGFGAINDATVDLPVGATATYTLTMTVPANFTGPLTNTATVTPGPATMDTNLANNSASDTDTAVARLTVSKVSQGGVGSFSFTGSNGIANQTLTTTVVGTPVSGTTQTLTASGTATTITEAAPPAGYTLTNIACTGMGTGGTATPNLASRTVTLDAAATAPGSNIACTFTNSRPRIRLQKSLPNGRLSDTALLRDQFALSIAGPSNGAATTATATTTGTGTSVTSAPAEFNQADSGATYTLSEGAAGSTNLLLYTTTYSCSNSAAGSTTVLPLGTGTSFTLTASGNDDILCTFINSPLPAATVTISKVSVGGTGTFSFSGNNGLTLQTLTTADAGVIVSGLTQTLTLALTSTTISETPSEPGFSLTAITCVGFGIGGSYLPTINGTAGGSVTLDVLATAPGSNINCAFTNTKLPTVTISKVSQGGVGSFSFSGSNGIVNQTLTTTVAGTPVSGAVQTLTTAGTVTTITEATPPVGYTLTGVICTGMGTGGTATPDLATRTVTLDAAATAAGANITCTFTNTRQPTLALAKTWVSAAVNDTATLSTTGGSNNPTLNSTANTASETDTGTAVQVSIGDVITLSETLGGINAGSYSASAWSCTGGTLNGSTLTLTASDAGKAIVCTITNTRQTTDIQVLKTASPNPVLSGQVLTYSITVTNNGPLGTTNVLLTDTPGPGLDCTTPGPTATCSASGGATCPGATVLVSDLLGAGVTIPTLPVGGQVVVTLNCTVTATGLP